MWQIRVGNDRTDRWVRIAASWLVGYLVYYGFH